jgi:hypothetical protein
VASKKIFITIPWFLPAFRAGGPIQSVANLVKEFREGVEYFIFCGDTDLNSSGLDNVETDEWFLIMKQKLGIAARTRSVIVCKACRAAEAFIVCHWNLFVAV